MNAPHDESRDESRDKSRDKSRDDAFDDEYGDPQFDEPTGAFDADDDDDDVFGTAFGEADAEPSDAADSEVGAPDYVLLHDAAHVWHPYTQHFDAPIPVHVTRAKGAWLHRASGAPILDAISSWWVTTHGHGHPDIASAIADQAKMLDQVIFAGFTHEPASALAAELVSRLPRGLSRVFFSDNGSTAVEVAIRMSLQSFANQGTPRRLVAALDHAYHGDTFGAMAVGARGVHTSSFDPLLFDVVRLPDPSEGDTIKALDAVLATRGSELAAVIVEPLLLGAGGMRVWDEAVLRTLRARTRDAGVHLIADEVLTGFGRTGPLFACDRADVSPDIMCLSKGLTGGALPLGATAATEAIYDAFRSADRSKAFLHGHAFAANPIACAAALASLELFDEDSEDDRVRIEVAHARELDALRGVRGVKATRQIGTVAAIELDALKGSLGHGAIGEIGRELAAFALEQNVLLRPIGNVAYCLPPYCTTDVELAGVYSVIQRFLGGERATPSRGSVSHVDR